LRRSIGSANIAPREDDRMLEHRFIVVED